MALPATYPTSCRLQIAAILFGTLTLCSEAKAQFTFATDNASNSAYSDGFQNGDNGGSGFNAWSITYGNSTGTFVGNPANDGMGTAGIGTTAWGAYANGNTSGWVNATRSLSTAMQVGDSLSFYWAMNWDSGGAGGSKGFDLKNSSGTNIFTLENTNTQTISYKNAGTGTVSGNYGTTPMLVTVNRTSSSQYQLTITRRDTTEGTFSLTINSALDLDRVNFYEGKQSLTNGNQNTYFNNLLNSNSGNYSSGGSRTESRALTGTGNFIVSNNTALTLTNSGNSFNGTTTIQSGTLALGSGGADGFIASTSSISNNGTLAYNLTSANTLGMVVSGTGSLLKQNTGDLTLGGSNSFTGGIRIERGAILISSDANLGAAPGSPNASYITMNNTAGTNLASLVATESFTMNSNRGITLQSSASSNSYFIGVASGKTLTYGGVITGPGNLVKNQDGTLSLSGANTFTGGVFIDRGTLEITAGTLGSGTLELGTTIGGDSAQAATLSIGASGLTISRNMTVNTGGARTLAFTQTSGESAVSGTLTLNRDFAVNVTNASATANLTGALTGSNKIFKDGAGTLVLSGSKAFSGQTQIGNGVVIANNSNSMGTGNTGTVTRGIDIGVSNDAATSTNASLLATNGVVIGQSIYIAPNNSGATRSIGLSGTGSAEFSNEIFLDGNLTLSAGSGNITVSGALLSTGGINAASGLSIFTANNSYTGATSIGSGASLQLGSGGTSGWFGSSSAISNNGTLIFNRSDNLTLSLAVSGSGALTKNGSGALTISSANTHSGGTTLNAGQLNLNNAAAPGSGSLTISGGTLDNTSGSAITLSNNNAQNWNGNFSFTGTNNLNLGTGAVTMNASRTVTVNGGTLTVGGAISGTGFSLSKNGTGTLVLGGANTYTGATLVNGGTLSLGASNRIADTSNLFVASGATFAMGGFSDAVGQLTGAGAVTLGAGTLTSTWNSGSGTFSGVLSGSGGLTVAGAADYNAFFTLSGTNTYTGATTLTGATLILGANNGISSSSALVISGGRLSASDRNQTFHSITMDAGAILRDGGTLAYTNGASLTGGSVTIRNSGGTLSSAGLTTLGNVTLTYNASIANFNAMVLGGNVAVNAGATALFENGPAGGLGYLKLGNANRVFDVGAGGNLNMNWIVTSDTLSSGGLTKNGTGTMTLNGVNLYTGGTTLNSGTLVLGHSSNTLADAGALTINGGTLAMGSNSDTIGALTLAGGSITGSTGVLTASSYALQSGTVSAILGGSASINKTTSGTVTLNAANTFSGGITLSEGQLNLNAAGALGSGNLTILGGTLGNTAGSSITLSSSAPQFWNANFAFAGPDTLNLGTGAVTINSTRTLTVSGGNLVVGGAISGAGFGLTKNGTGTLTLSGANTYSNTTTVNAGTLALGASDVIANSSDVTVASGAALALNSFSDTIGKLTGAGSVTLGSGTLTTTYGSGSGEFSGVLSGTGSFTLAGAANYNAFLTISGSNTYTGTTNVLGATLILGANNVLSSSSTLNIDGGRFSASNRNQTLHSITMASGVIERNGGTLAFNNSSSFTGGNVNIGNDGGTIQTSGTTTLGNVTFTYNASTANFNALILGGNVEVDNGATATMTNGSAGGSGYIKLNDSNRVFSVGTDANLNVNWIITSNTLSAGSLTKNGSGTLTLNGSNPYTGGTTINAGTLVLGHVSNTLADAGAVTINGGTLSLGSNNDTIGALTLAGGSITGSSGVLTASSYALQNGTVSAILGGSASINKTTDGTVMLNAANTFSGGITLGGGTLVIGNANAAGSGTLTQSGGSSLLSINTTGTIANTMSLYNVSALQSATLSGTITVNNASFDVEEGDTLTISGGVGGTGGVTKNGAGALVLSGSNTYSGATVVNAGLLEAANSNALGNSTSVTVNGGSLLVSADGAINSKNITLDSNNTLVAGLAFAGTYNGTAGSLTLAKNSIIDLGTGSVVLHFSDLVMGIYNLDIYNWTGTTLWGGGDGNNTDQFYIDRSLTSSELNRISFHSGGLGSSSFVGTGYQLSGGSFNNEVIPVPEPETWFAAGLLAGLGLLGLLRKKNPSIQQNEPLV